MKYIIKDTIINLEDDSKLVYYLGKDGYVHDFKEYAEPYSKKGFAIKYIEREMNSSWMKKIDEFHSIESGKWLHHYNIIEVAD